MNEQVSPQKELEDQIKKLVSGIEKLNNGRLSKKAILILLASASGVSQGVIIKVFKGIEKMPELFLQKESKTKKN